jgi:hypothetical protein
VSDDEDAQEPAQADETSDSADEMQESAPGEGPEPTPEAPKRVRQPPGQTWDGIYPKLNRDVANIIGKGKIFDKYFSDLNLGRFSALDAAFKPVLGRLSSRSLLESVVGDFMLPVVEPSWLKQFSFINSDIYKLAGVGQWALTDVTSSIFKHADFGLNTNVAALFATQQLSWLKDISSTLEFLRTGFYPLNLRDIQDLEFEEIEKVVMLDGIALYGVPRQDIAEKLIRADSAAARRDILGRRWKAISADCRVAVDGCTSTAVAPYLTFAEAALDALDADNPKAAQALAALVLDTVVNGYFGAQRYALTPNKTTTTTVEYEKFNMREFIAFAPLWKSYQKFKNSDGDSVPTTFSRHASVHGVSAKQYSRRNAVQAVLFVSSLLMFLDEEARRNEGQDLAA